MTDPEILCIFLALPTTLAVCVNYLCRLYQEENQDVKERADVLSSSTGCFLGVDLAS